MRPYPKPKPIVYVPPIESKVRDISKNHLPKDIPPIILPKKYIPYKYHPDISNTTYVYEKNEYLYSSKDISMIPIDISSIKFCPLDISSNLYDISLATRIGSMEPGGIPRNGTHVYHTDDIAIDTSYTSYLKQKRFSFFGY